jgi:6-pyruvoyltetrahydropterin/6-carboxytetrahydropterin synthase
VLQEEIRDRFDHRNINTDVPEFADGKLIPTGENLARFIFERLDSRLGNHARVDAVTVAEDDTLSATYSRE